MPGWGMGLSSGAWKKDYFASMDFVKVSTLFQLLDEEAFVNFDKEGNPKNIGWLPPSSQG
jgi:hypothetical protein